MPVQKLTPELQRLVVDRLACCESLFDIERELRENHGVGISRSALLHYDPTTCQGQELRKELKDFFNARREQYMRDALSAPIAHPGYRMALLQQMAEKAMLVNNFRGAIAAIAEATRQVGGYNSRAMPIDMAQHTPTNVSPPSETIADAPVETNKPKKSATTTDSTKAERQPAEPSKTKQVAGIASKTSLLDEMRGAIFNGKAIYAQPQMRAQRDRLTARDIMDLLPPDTIEPESTAKAFLQWLNGGSEEPSGFP